MGTDVRSTGSDGEFSEFERALSALHGSGSAFLLTGNVGSTAHSLACRRHLGAERPDASGRILVTRADRSGVAPAASSGRSANRTRVVELAAEYRSAAAGEGADGAVPTDQTGPSSPSGSTVDSGGLTTTVADLGQLGAGTLRAIEAVEPAGGFEPGELRLCFDAIAPTVDQYGEEELFQFLHLLVARVRAADGRLHAHLYGERDDRFCTLFEPLFDGVVELRNRDDEPEQRWHLRDADVTSEWLSLGV